MTGENYIEREKSKERKMGWRGWFSSSAGLVLVVFLLVNLVVMASKENGSFGEPEANVKRGNGKQKHKKYSEALMKSILFFEGQRSGPLPSSQRMKWRKDSALDDGKDVGVDLVGGYYDAGDNLKFNFPMAFSVTVLSWGVLEFGEFMGPELKHAKEAIKWGTDYFLKSTSVPDKVFVQVGEPYGDHACWERPEDMDTNRTAYAVDKDHPGSEVAAEIAAALASSSLVFKDSDPRYSDTLLQRAIEVFQFADTYRGSYNDSLGPIVCPFYCDWSGYQDELLWGAAWIYKASNKSEYLNYVVNNVYSLEDDDAKKGTCTIGEFGWDNKHAGVNVLIANELLAMKKNSDIPQSFLSNANQFVCYILPDSPTNSVKYSPGGLLFKSGGSQMQNPAALSFLLLVYATHLNEAKEVVQCGGLTAGPDRLISIAKSQADYILGNNPAKMSYMVGFGRKFPQRIHHRGSSLPSIDDHPKCIPCHEGTPYFESKDPNPNVLIGAVTGGPDINDKYEDSRSLFVQSEPTTYINAPLVGVFAYFHHFSS